MAKNNRPSPRHRPSGVEILHEDRDILVVDKAPGLLTMGSEREKERTAYYRLTDYVRKGSAKSRNRIFIVHRLDREVSGVLVFAKTIEAKEQLQGQWESTEKKYLAVVQGVPTSPAGTITSYLAENAAHVVYSSPDPSKGKLSHTGYRVLKAAGDLCLLEVDLLTGRKNQIRVHLADAGHPIVGDAKYGRRDAGRTRIALHAWSLAFDHPYSGKRMTFSTAIPGYFKRLVGGYEDGPTGPAESISEEGDR